MGAELGEAMPFRGKSIRRKIVALLLVPLLSLTAIWGFTTFLTVRDVDRLFEVSDVVEKIGYPAEDTVQVLQEERRQTLVHLADPRASDALTALRRSRAATDRAVTEIRESGADGGLRDKMGEGTSARLTAVLDALDGLPSLRSSVQEGTVDVSQAYDLYNSLVDPAYLLLVNLQTLDNVELDKQGRALVNVARARELLAREDALLSSALVSGRLTRDEVRKVTDLVAQRRLTYEVNLPLLPAAERERFERYWTNAGTTPLRIAERAVIDSGPGTPTGVTAKSWDAAAGQVLDELADLGVQSGDRFQERVRPLVVAVIVKAAVPGLLGLAAVLISLFLSVRVGRAHIRDLRRLRQEAHEAAEVRLPSVMRRLSAGEKVDVETEAPLLEYEKTEIGAVGQAVNTLQHAAVEAAVKQSELRDGISEVFVNLARRSQVLLHKQLTLLDTMERRTEDTEELADLFRLDHLTTRMRRHAEGLVILSGAAPSRQWRKPVQLMDVVRAAVAEVEDYERIEVRRLPRVAVTGPAVADLTHLVAELLENATVFSPPHTAVQVLGERVANGFALEINDRGLGMSAEALLDANLRLAETPEFELSDTDRLGLFVVSRLAQRQNVRVSLQPSPYGGTTAVVFIPDALLSDDVPDTNGIGFRLDRAHPTREAEIEAERRAALAEVPVRFPGLPAPPLDGPVELEAPDDRDTLADTGGPVPLPRRRKPKLVSSHGRPVTGGAPQEDEELPQHSGPAMSGTEEPDQPPARPGRSAPSRVRSAGHPESAARDGEGPSVLTRRRRTDPLGSEGSGKDIPRADSGKDIPRAGTGKDTPRAGARGGEAESEDGALPRRVRQASLAPQLRGGPARHPEPGGARREEAALADRDAEEVRSRMASLQRGWQRGRQENAVGDQAQDGAAQGTNKGDGR
ncbi:histidine kinase [Streptomyces poonensis]|uniref:histidine kinase n=2 Tax=Streptomyces poonensis TaxID=68255 RepID=A0A918PHK2_9ACTN|nr:histidine kinase [Streptomyces poonensis]GLJ93848.1 histidine kinase [Streptomyces poonensis]